MPHRRQGHPLRETRIVDMYMARGGPHFMCQVCAIVHPPQSWLQQLGITNGAQSFQHIFAITSKASFLEDGSLRKGGREKGGEIEPKRRRIRCWDTWASGGAGVMGLSSQGLWLGSCLFTENRTGSTSSDWNEFYEVDMFCPGIDRHFGIRCKRVEKSVHRSLHWRYFR